MDHKSYMNFLIERHQGLNLPYPFAMKLGFLSSPLLFGKAVLAIEEDSYEVVGAAGFVYGTGDEENEDRGVCQLEVLYLEPAYRSSLLFPRFLQSIVELMKEGEPSVHTVRFWARPQLEERLFSKFLRLEGSARTTADNGLMLHQAPYRELESYCKRLRRG